MSATVPLDTPVVVRPAPRREPPFDDEIAPRLMLVGTSGGVQDPLPFAPPPARQRREVPPEPLHPYLPDPGRWSRRLLTGIFECAAGRRPLQQLTVLLTPSVAYGLGADFEKAAHARRPHWTHAARVHTTRASVLSPGVAEVSATVGVGGRVRAIALRVEEHRGRWRCTRLQLG